MRLMRKLFARLGVRTVEGSGFAVFGQTSFCLVAFALVLGASESQATVSCLPGGFEKTYSIEINGYRGELKLAQFASDSIVGFLQFDGFGRETVVASCTSTGEIKIYRPLAKQLYLGRMTTDTQTGATVLQGVMRVRGQTNTYLWSARVLRPECSGSVTINANGFRGVMRLTSLDDIRFRGALMFDGFAWESATGECRSDGKIEIHRPSSRQSYLGTLSRDASGVVVGASGTIQVDGAMTNYTWQMQTRQPKCEGWFRVTSKGRTGLLNIIAESAGRFSGILQFDGQSLKSVSGFCDGHHLAFKVSPGGESYSGVWFLKSSGSFNAIYGATVSGSPLVQETWSAIRTSPPPALMPITFTNLEHVQTGNGYVAYGTFSSHYQQVVQNSRGLFVSFLKSYLGQGGNGANDKGIWVLRWSKDGGKSFATIYSQTAVKGPCLETDGEGNLHLAWPTNQLRDMYYVKLVAAEGYTPPRAILIPGAGAGKYSCFFNPNNAQFAMLTWSHLIRVNTSKMSLVDVRPFFLHGARTVAQYPVLTMDPGRSMLIGGWTTQNKAFSTPAYYDARYLASWDFGSTWGPASVGNTAKLPVLPDASGPGTQVVLTADLQRAKEAMDAGTQGWNNWMDSILFQAGHLHFMYTTPKGIRYVRHGLNGATTASMTQFKGSMLALSGYGAYFVSGRKGEIYAVGGTTTPQIAVLVSRDNGTTWKDFAASEVLPRRAYAVTGFRRVTDDGYIIGQYTEKATAADTSVRVRFFKIKAL
jgi:hypothetical protein